jgi:hypothetical protein
VKQAFPVLDALKLASTLLLDSVVVDEPVLALVVVVVVTGLRLVFVVVTE